MFNLLEFDSKKGFPSIDMLENDQILVLKNFLDEKICHEIVNRIYVSKMILPNSEKPQYIGPFLMSYITSKTEYFRKAKDAIGVFDELFSVTENPLSKIQQVLYTLFPYCKIQNASENNFRYSPCIIRVHPIGTSIPLHKDFVSYEGVNYSVSHITHQLSCVLHLQEPEKGGELKVYKKEWSKTHERFREIDFGYSNLLIKQTDSCVISPKTGDLVIINPKNFHEVKTIKGNKPRITLGLFAGLVKKKNQVLLWA